MNNPSISDSQSTSHKIGIIGGGQLSYMLVDAAKRRDLEVLVQTASNNDPVAHLTKDLVLSPSEDYQATQVLIENCNSITFENEWINIDGLLSLNIDNSKFLPTLLSLKPLVDKLSQRRILNQLSIPVADWIILSDFKIPLTQLPKGWNFPLMAKASRGGYDGKGTIVVHDIEELNNLLLTVDNETWFLEKWQTYEHELAIVATRDTTGIVRSFPLVETHQSEQVCDWVYAPSNLPNDVELMAFNIASSLLSELNYFGVITIEFFYGPNGLKVNEIAPRTHNSAHFSIEACASSQFDQQICIAAGIPVPIPNLIVPGALMVNLLGLNSEYYPSIDKRLEDLRKLENTHLHWYGKDSERPGRKLGHVTALLYEDDPRRRKQEAILIREKIRSIWPLPNGKLH